MDEKQWADWLDQLETAQTFFNKSTACLDDKDGPFRATPDTSSITEHVAHAAQTVDWFLDGAVEPIGFRMDFEELAKETRSIKSLPEARAWFARAMERAQALIKDKPREFWEAPFPAGLMFGGDPRCYIFGAIVDHTAHHRGALTVLARLCGRTPSMPYGPM